jgi:hypothetical protein
MPKCSFRRGFSMSWQWASKPSATFGKRLMRCWRAYRIWASARLLISGRLLGCHPAMASGLQQKSGVNRPALPPHSRAGALFRVVPTDEPSVSAEERYREGPPLGRNFFGQLGSFLTTDNRYPSIGCAAVTGPGRLPSTCLSLELLRPSSLEAFNNVPRKI